MFVDRRVSNRRPRIIRGTGHLNAIKLRFHAMALTDTPV
jgi:hypothetical protein